MAGVVPPWHDGCHGSPVWSAKCWLAGNGRRSAEGLAQGALPLDPGLRAAGAQGRRGTCRLAGVLPPWHDGRHGSPVWSAKCWLAGNGRRSAEGLAQGALPLDPGLRAAGAQGRRGTCRLAGVLPPWHDGRHGSPVWSAKCWLAGTDSQGAVIRNLNRRLWHCRAKSSFRLTAVGR